MKIKILLLAVITSITLFSQTQDTAKAANVIEKYLTAIGGREKLNALKDRVTEMNGTVQNFDVRITIFQKKPDLFKQVLKAKEVEQTVLFNGEKGIIKTNEVVKEITGAELEKLKVDSDMNFMLSKDTSLVKFIYLGDDTAANSKVHKIKVETSSGSWTQYYDANTGFRLKDEKPIATPQGDFTQTSWYSDFREVNGLWFPFKIKQVMGKQIVEFVVESIKINQNIKDSVFRIPE